MPNASICESLGMLRNISSFWGISGITLDQTLDCKAHKASSIIRTSVMEAPPTIILHERLKSDIPHWSYQQRISFRTFQ